jgi:Fic family protein
MEAELTHLLSEADRALGRLDGVATVLPNPNLFVAMYVRQEAVLSSQSEPLSQSPSRRIPRPADGNPE